MTIQGLYNSIKSGDLSEIEFLMEVKRDSRLKNIITINNNFHDAVNILKNKGIISESGDDTENGKFDVNAAIQKLREIRSDKYDPEHLGYLIKKINNKEWKIVDSYPTDKDATIAARDRRDARLKGVASRELRSYGIAQPESHLFWLSEDQLNEGKNKLKGRKGDKLTPDDVNYYEFQKGWKHELEHTDDIDKAKEIALDHLAEDPNYYTHLEMIEYVANKKKRTDLPIEYKKGQEKDKDNQMTPVKSVTTSISGKVATKKIEKHTKNVSDKKERPKKVKTKVMKGGSGKDTVKSIKENFDTNEAVNNIGKIQKYADAINVLIKNAIDSDGDPLEIVDTSGTWEQPYKVLPIEIKGNRIYINSVELEHGREKIDKTVHNLSDEIGMDDAIADMRLISKLYKKAYKKNKIPLPVGIKEAMSVDKAGKLKVQSDFDREAAQTSMEEIGAYAYKSGSKVLILLNKYGYPSMKNGYFVILARGEKEPLYTHKEDNLDSFLDYVEDDDNNYADFSREVDDIEYDEEQNGKGKISDTDFSVNEVINKKQLKMFPTDKVDVKKVLDIYKRSMKGDDTSAAEEQLNKVEKHRLDALRSAKMKESVIDEAPSDRENYEVKAVVNGKIVTKVMSLSKSDYDDIMKTVKTNVERIEQNKKSGESRVRVSGPFQITSTTKKTSDKKITKDPKEVESKSKFWWKTDDSNNWSSGELSAKELKALVDKFKKDNIKVMTDDEYQKTKNKIDTPKVGSKINYDKFKQPEKTKGKKTSVVTTYSDDALKKMSDKKLKDLMKSQGIDSTGNVKKTEPKSKPVVAEPPKGSKVKINPTDNSVYLVSEKEKKVFNKLFNNRQEAKEYLDKNPNLKNGAYVPVPARALETVKQRWDIKEDAIGENITEENLRETIKAILSKKIKEYNTYQAQEGPNVKLKELERLLQGFSWGKPENNYQQLNKQESANKIKKLVSELGEEGKDLVKQYMPKDGSIDEDHMHNKQDQIDYIVASGHYKGTKDKLGLMGDDDIKKIYDTVERIEKERKIKKGGSVDLGKSFDKFKKDIK